MNTKILKNLTVAKKVGVAHPTIARWIDDAMNKGNNLELEEDKNRYYIKDSTHNWSELLRLKEKNFKYRNKISYEKVIPSSDVYNIFESMQLIEIINALQTKREIPFKFTYLDRGAEIWDKFINRGVTTGNYSVSSQVNKLLSDNFHFIQNKIDAYDKVNVIDLGPGNFYPVVGIIDKLISINKLNKYIPVDISKEMLSVSVENAKKKYPYIEVESYVKDYEIEDLGSVLFSNKINPGNLKVLNLVLLLGGNIGTLADKHKTLKTLRHAFGMDDLFIFTNKQEKLTSKAELNHLSDIYDLFLWIPKLLGIDVDKCEIKPLYNESKGRRQISIVLDKDYSVEFEFLNSFHQVDLFKGEEIALWYHEMSTFNKVIDDMNFFDFNTVHISTDQNNILSINETKK